MTDKGLKPDVKKDVAAVRRLQGMITYLAIFLSRLCILRLYHRRGQQLGRRARDRDESAEEIVITAPLLAHYGPAMKLTIQWDASSTDLGATLMQEAKSRIRCRVLFDTKVGYAQIEKECITLSLSLCLSVSLSLSLALSLSLSLSLSNVSTNTLLFEKQRCTPITIDLKRLSRSRCPKATKRIQGMLL